MKRFVGIIFSGLLFCGLVFAADVITNGSYSIEGNIVRLYWTDLSEGGIGNIDVNVRDSDNQSRKFIGNVDSREQSFSYEKLGNGSQEVWLTPNNGSEGLHIYVNSINSYNGDSNTNSYVAEHGLATEHGSAGEIEYAQEESHNTSNQVTRTVIAAVPKTGPSGNLIGIIVATLVIFGGYIYIKKRADI